jgi:hypothetical protein
VLRFGLNNRGGEFSCSSRSGGSGVRVAARPAGTQSEGIFVHLVVTKVQSVFVTAAAERYMVLENHAPH